MLYNNKAKLNSFLFGLSRKLLIMGVCFCAISFMYAQGTENVHKDWDELLNAHVNEQGLVDYHSMKAERIKLDRYLEHLESIACKYNADNDAALAFWLNVYNALTVQVIIDNYPVNSMRDIDEGRVWKVERFRFQDRYLSLDHIEHDIIRKRFGDPRIHFALNCGAISCPPLHNKAFNSTDLHQVLEQLSSQFINNPRYNRLEDGKLFLSKIFEWYEADFGNLAKFVKMYASYPVRETQEIIFQEYNWSLNSQ